MNLSSPIGFVQTWTSAEQVLEQIQEIGPDRLNEVIEMDLECDHEIMRLNGARPRDMKRFVREHRKSFLSAYQRPGEQRIYAASVDDRLAGFIWVKIESEMEEMVPIGFIYSIFVRKGFRRNGVGTSLIRKAEDYCRTRGVDRLELIVNARNSKAFELYRRMGFKTRRYTLEKNIAN